MKYIDISQTIAEGMKECPSDPMVRIEHFKLRHKGDSCNLFRLEFGSHTGTHIDAPRHIFYRGRTIDKIKMKDLICDVLVADVKDISKKDFFNRIHREW